MLDAEEMRKIAAAACPEEFSKAKAEIAKAANRGDFSCMLEIGENIDNHLVSGLMTYLEKRGYQTERRWYNGLPEATHIYVSWDVQ